MHPGSGHKILCPVHHLQKPEKSLRMFYAPISECSQEQQETIFLNVTLKNENDCCKILFVAFG